MPAQKLCTYAGLFGLYIRTYTTTYVSPSGGWSFDPNCLLPQDFCAYDSGALNPVGMQGNIFDLVAGTTNYKVGDVTAHNAGANYGKLQPNNKGRLQGFLYASGAGQKPVWWMDFPFAFGTNFISPAFNYNTVLTYGAGANTGSPNPAAGNNFLTVAGVYTSGNIGATGQNYLQMQSNGNLLVSPVGFSLGFAGGDGFTATMPAPDGLNYCAQSALIHQTDFVGIDNSFNPIFQNPPGAYDLNAWLQANAFGGILLTITPLGWLIFNQSTVTMDGANLSGFGVLIAPDFSRYWVIQIVPTDANSVGWNGGTQPQGKFDRNGNLFFKPFNISATIFVSTGIVDRFRNLPVFPPIALPAPPDDTETTLNLYRGIS